MPERVALRVARSVAVDDQRQELPSATMQNHFAIQTIKPLLTVDDLCALLQISRRTLERMRSVGTAPAPDVTLGMIGKRGQARHPRWKAESVIAWLEGGAK
jgi:hypothetical protein